MCFSLTLIAWLFVAAGTAGAGEPRPFLADTVSVHRHVHRVWWTVSEPVRPWEFVVIHHSATMRGSVESIHRDHRSRRDRNGQPWLGIGYHFVIGNGSGMPDGHISPTFRWKQQLHGAHSGSLLHNGHGIGICLIGNFEEHPPTAAQRASVVSLLRRLTRQYRIPKEKVIGHRHIRATACPGRLFPLKEIVKEAMSGNVAFIPTR